MYAMAPSIYRFIRLIIGKRSMRGVRERRLTLALSECICLCGWGYVRPLLNAPLRQCGPVSQIDQLLHAARTSFKVHPSSNGG